MGERGKVRVAGCDVGRVAEDEVDAVGGEGREPVGLDEGEVGQPVCARVFFGDGECVRALVGGGYARVRAGGGDGKRQCAATGAEVDDGRRAQVAQVVQGAFDEDFAVAARDEGGVADFEVEAVKRLVAEEVGEGFAGVQARSEGVQRLLLCGADLRVVDALRGGREAGDVCGEVAGFDGGDFGVGMGGDGLGEPVVEVQGLARQQAGDGDELGGADVAVNVVLGKARFEAVGRRIGQAFDAVFAREVGVVAGAFGAGVRAAVDVGVVRGGVGG